MIKQAIVSSIAALVLLGCHPTPKTGFLAPDANGAAGYRAQGPEGVFENGAVRLSARQMKPTEEAPALIARLLKEGYMVIVLSIENRSRAEMIYKPNYTALTNDKLDYKKPLDYTDLYEIDQDGVDSLKGLYYDLDLTLSPGEKASRALIFGPLTEGYEKVSLEISDLYVGTRPASMKLPFTVKAEP